MIDVQHHRLRTFEQNAPAGPPRLVQPLPHRLRERQHQRRQGDQPREHIRLGKCFSTKALQQRIVVQQQLVQLIRQRLRLGQIGNPDGPARGLVLVRGADAATGGADLAIPPRRLPRAVERRVHRQDQRGVLGDPQRGRRHSMPCVRTFSISASSASGSTTTPLPMMPILPRTSPDGSSDSL